MMNESEKKPIIPTLRDMRVNDVQEWPIERYDSIRITVSRANLMMRPEGKKFSIRAKDMKVEVIRIA
jgi:hypothetical protein